MCLNFDLFQDVQYADIDYMDEQKSFTVDPINYVGLGEFIDDVHAHGQRFIIILVSLSLNFTNLF